MANIKILDAELVCFTCGQKIKLVHLRCQKEKRQKRIQEFLDDLVDIWNNTTFFNDNDMSEFLKKQKKWEARRK